jgi:hypothetical protein
VARFDVPFEDQSMERPPSPKRPSLPERIVLIGMMGSGKSTTGRLLASRLGWRYLDNDEDVRTLTDREPSDVIRLSGEHELHAAEASAFLRALTSPPPVVIAAAAGVVLDETCETRCVVRAPVYLRRDRRRCVAASGRAWAGGDATDLQWLDGPRTGTVSTARYVRRRRR